MTQVRTIFSNELTLENVVAILRLTSLVWRPAEGVEAPDPTTVLANWRGKQGAHFVISDDDIAAHAHVFKRDVFTAQGPLSVGALAAVCLHPKQRRHGWGAEVVRAAFEGLPVCRHRFLGHKAKLSQAARRREFSWSRRASSGLR